MKLHKILLTGFLSIGTTLVSACSLFNNKVKVIFNANGGNQDEVVVSISKSSTIPNDQIPTFSKDGYSFNGWSKDTSGESTFDLSSKINEDTTLYAKWEIVPVVKVNVTFDPNGGEGETTIVSTSKGSPINKEFVPTFIKEGCSLYGWSLEPNSTKRFDLNTVINEDITLYAIWDDGEIVYDDFQVHFLELGNAYCGDSIYIKAGENDILIDAGSKYSSTETLMSYLDEHVLDHKLEYVIATHAHEDHIAGFSNGTSKDGILYNYDVDNLIQFSTTNAKSYVYKYYQEAVEYAKNKGTNVTNASDYFDENHNPKENATITLGEDLTMNIIYNIGYFEYQGNENDSSVCTLFTYKDKNFLLTGDAEANAEASMVSYYDGSSEAKTLPHVELFKAGHHGSKTSSSEDLLEMIQPKSSVACCCAGSTQYTTNYKNTFPTQAYIDRISKWTDRVYVTTLGDEYDKSKFSSLNGNMVVSTDGENIGYKGSNNSIKLKDSEWFNHLIYVKDGKIVEEGTEGATQVPARDMPSYWK